MGYQKQHFLHTAQIFASNWDLWLAVLTMDVKQLAYFLYLLVIAISHFHGSASSRINLHDHGTNTSLKYQSLGDLRKAIHYRHNCCDENTKCVNCTGTLCEELQIAHKNPATLVIETEPLASFYSSKSFKIHNITWIANYDVQKQGISCTIRCGATISLCTS